MIKSFELNEVGRDFVVGDIHGCFGELSRVLKDEVFFDESKDRLFSVGDLVDRGIDSKQCIKWLHKPWFHAVCGNHEVMAIEAFNKEYPVGIYIANGGQWFIDLPEDEQEIYVRAFNDLPYIIEVKTKNGLIGILHAEYPWMTWEEKTNLIESGSGQECCIWSRSRISYGAISKVEGIEKIYVGHTPVKEITILGNHIYIDTGAVFNKKLTIIEL